MPSDYEDLNRLEVEKQQTGRGQDSTKLERMEGKQCVTIPPLFSVSATQIDRLGCTRFSGPGCLFLVLSNLYCSLCLNTCIIRLSINLAVVPYAK